MTIPMWSKTRRKWEHWLKEAIFSVFSVESRVVSSECRMGTESTKKQMGLEWMSLEVTSIGFVGTNPKSTPLPGVDYLKIKEVYEEK